MNLLLSLAAGLVMRFYIDALGKQCTCLSFWRCRPDLNWGVKVLQTFALPLGHGTGYENRNAAKAFLFILERVTRLELATSTLARSRSTR